MSVVGQKLRVGAAADEAAELLETTTIYDTRHINPLFRRSTKGNVK